MDSTCPFQTTVRFSSARAFRAVIRSWDIHSQFIEYAMYWDTVHAMLLRHELRDSYRRHWRHKQQLPETIAAVAWAHCLHEQACPDDERAARAFWQRYCIDIPTRQPEQIFRARLAMHRDVQREQRLSQHVALRIAPMAPITIQPSSRPALAVSLRFRILRRDNFRCQLCGATARDGARLEVDHRQSRSHGGTDAEANLWTLCLACNRGKGPQSL